jgi:hypothetical protein
LAPMLIKLLRGANGRMLDRGSRSVLFEAETDFVPPPANPKQHSAAPVSASPIAPPAARFRSVLGYLVGERRVDRSALSSF